ncbi:T9SS type B sorting domain-containing protein [Arenibacter amylolyticus]|uniref:T9SS type B sorting domain-containing protein n=1 Tax=Arenibacter amylolyticus TaxID=1406873 RepID=UPI001FE8B3F1|nr:gliding motility-associated C-terminal domain-containing protein [Arenibacter amylolyticus]
MKLNLPNGILMIFLSYLALGMTFGSAQTLNKPTPADNPNLAGNSVWTAACGSESFNEYFVNFTWLPSVAADNEFILELSDANGVFTNPTELSRVSDKNANFDFNFSFSLPNTTRGDGYRFRVRSTNPAKTSPVSDAFEMYYIDYNSPLQIREMGDTAPSPAMKVELCDGGTTTLEVYNIANAETYRYNWYKDTSPFTVAGHGPSIEVSEGGFYVVELDYGATCSGSSNTQSLSIEVQVGSSVGLEINPPTKAALCTGEAVAPLEANMNYADLYYTWFKDGSVIQPSTLGAYTYTINTNDAQFPGNYTVQVQGNGICTETSSPLTITQAGDFTVSRDNPANMVLLPGKSINLNVSADTSPVTYQWYKDSVALSGETGSSLTANSDGVYHAEVTYSGGSCPITTKISDPTTVVLPANFELTIDYVTEYTDCVNTSIALEVTKIDAILSDGSKLEVTSELEPDFIYQWTKDGSNVAAANSSTISFTDTAENGNYAINASLDSFTSVSNILPVQLQSNEILTISSTATLFCSPSDLVSISSDTALSGETFYWSKDGSLLPDTAEVLSVSEPGTYQLTVNKNGCDLLSNEVVITTLDDSLLILNPAGGEILFPEGSSKEIYASGASSYQWFNENNMLLGDSDSLTLTQEGTYRVVGLVNDCQVSKTFVVTYQDTFGVPNVVTANGDGYNDVWVLPNSYTKDPEIQVIIYNQKGQEVLNQFQYQNNWPAASMNFPRQNMVFYYTIRKANKTLKKGTITVIR